MKTWLLICFLFPSVIFTQNSDWAYRNPYPQTDFYGIKFFNQNTGYLIGAEGTFLKSTTGSNSWVSIPSFTSRDLYGMYFFDVNTGYVVGSGGHIFYTFDGGTSWTSVVTNNALPLRSVTFTSQNTGYISGDNGELYKTITGITGWQRIDLSSNLNFNKVYFLNENKGFVCADSGKVFQTTNSGMNWIEQDVTWQNILCMEFVDQLKGFIGTGASVSGSSSNLFSTTDGGNTWANVPMLITPRNWNSISFINQNTGFVTGEDAPILITTNGGAFWSVYGAPPTTTMYSSTAADTNIFICGSNGWISKMSPGGDQTVFGGSKKNFKSISFRNENTGIVISDYQMLTTTNGGLNWNIKMVGGLNWHEGHSTYAIWTNYFQSGNLCLQYHTYIPTVIGEETVYFSTSNGESWDLGYNTRGYINGVDEAGGTVYLSTLSSPSGIYKGSGNNFTLVYTNTGSALGKVTFANQNTGLVLGGGSTKGMMQTTNGGINWSFVATGINKDIKAIKLLSSGNGFLAGDSGFFMKSTNFGSNWSLMNTGLNQNCIDMKFLDDNNGWLLYYGGSWPGNYRLYFTKNGGNNFYPVSSLGNFNVKAFSFVNPDVGYVCGDSGMVLKTTNGGLTFISQNTGLFPDNYSLSQNYPNPFNPVTNIRFEIPLPRGVTEGRGVLVKLIIYDIMGREITQLINQQMQPGNYIIDWDASNFPSGVYFYKLEAGDFSETKRMVLIK